MSMSKTKALMEEADDTVEDLTKSAMLGRALGVAFAVFFFAMFFFVGIVIVFAKFASKISPSGAQ